MKLAEAHEKLKLIDLDKAPVPGKNKGDRGQWVENQVGLNLSSNLNDFEDGELKTFKNGQTVAVTMLNHCLKEIIESVSYNDSNVGKKLRHVLIAKFSEKNGKFVESVVMSKETHDNLCDRIEEDFNLISDKIRTAYKLKVSLNQLEGQPIRNGELSHTITGKNRLLQIRTGGSGKGVPETYEDVTFNSNSKMRFYLTAKFTREIF